MSDQKKYLKNFHFHYHRSETNKFKHIAIITLPNRFENVTKLKSILKNKQSNKQTSIKLRMSYTTKNIKWFLQSMPHIDR